ncbi:MAG: hypothetical protein HY459_02520 [Parcubacteria group bacterium]|nr:hypothetical protein [Parcubacteria group bacterium]
MTKKFLLLVAASVLAVTVWSGTSWAGASPRAAYADPKFSLAVAPIPAEFLQRTEGAAVEVNVVAPKAATPSAGTAPEVDFTDKAPRRDDTKLFFSGSNGEEKTRGADKGKVNLLVDKERPLAKRDAKDAGMVQGLYAGADADAIDKKFVQPIPSVPDTVILVVDANDDGLIFDQLDFNFQEKARLEFVEALISEIGFPVLDDGDTRRSGFDLPEREGDLPVVGSDTERAERIKLEKDMYSIRGRRWTGVSGHEEQEKNAISAPDQGLERPRRPLVIGFLNKNLGGSHLVVLKEFDEDSLYNLRRNRRGAASEVKAANECEFDGKKNEKKTHWTRDRFPKDLTLEPHLMASLETSTEQELVVSRGGVKAIDPYMGDKVLLGKTRPVKAGDVPRQKIRTGRQLACEKIGGKLDELAKQISCASDIRIGTKAMALLIDESKQKTKENLHMPVYEVDPERFFDKVDGVLKYMGPPQHEKTVRAINRKEVERALYPNAKLVDHGRWRLNAKPYGLTHVLDELCNEDHDGADASRTSLSKEKL